MCDRTGWKLNPTGTLSISPFFFLSFLADYQILNVLSSDVNHCNLMVFGAEAVLDQF